MTGYPLRIYWGGVKLFDLEEYIEYIICAEIKKDEEYVVTTRENNFSVYNAEKLYELDSASHVIWTLFPDYLSGELLLLLSEIANLREIEIFCNREKYRERTRGFFVQRILEPIVFCMRNHLSFSEEEIEREWTEIKKIISDGGLVIPNIAFEITTKCTLRCKHCVEYVPWIPKIDADVSTVIEQTKKILDVVDYILYYQVTTGECLLYPELDKLLEFVIGEPRIKRMLILTNGVVLPGPRIMELLTNEKFYIQMSDYNQPMQKKNLENYQQAGVRIKFFEGQVWYDWAGDVSKIYSRNLNLRQLKVMYAKCRQGKSCPRIICDGKLYNCGVLRRFEQLGDYSSVRDGFELEKINDREVLREKLIDNYLVDYLEGCDYCDHLSANTMWIPAGEQL